MNEPVVHNPFRPGAGHMPPYLAGREDEKQGFLRLLNQDVVVDNLVLTGLRGVGKTVLLDTLKPLAIQNDWVWVGAEFSESASITEDRLATRLMTDLAVVTSSIILGRDEYVGMGLRPEKVRVERTLDYNTMHHIYDSTPGLASDKVKTLLEMIWRQMEGQGKRGVVIAYDEAQTLSDHSVKEEFPLSLLLDVFQSIQKKGMRLLLVLVGLPTLFPKLVEARTFSERMFRVVFLDRLNESDSREAILRPIEDSNSPLELADDVVELVIRASAGYPYFIQFIAREILDSILQLPSMGRRSYPQMLEDILRKLDTDFFAGRWTRATDRQRELLVTIANLPTCEHEFTVQEVVEKSAELLKKSFGASQVTQMLAALGNAGLVYKNRHGKYSFAVPLLGGFILRQQQRDQFRTQQLPLFE